MSGIQICCFSGRNKRKIMNYEKLSVIKKTGSNAGLNAKCYFHMQVMYHNLFSFYVLFIKCFDNYQKNVGVAWCKICDKCFV